MTTNGTAAQLRQADDIIGLGARARTKTRVPTPFPIPTAAREVIIAWGEAGKSDTKRRQAFWGGYMHPRFAEVVNDLHPAFERLMAMDPIIGSRPPLKMPSSGIYLFSEGDRHLYVGRSNRIRKRYYLHCGPGAKHNQASFAFKLAREATNRMDATYKAGAGRKEMALETEFLAAFTVAKARIRAMSYRYVEVTDQTRQALLEAYACIVLQTPYNDFDTH